MRRRSIAAILLPGLLAVAAAGCRPAPERVVLISIDTLRADRLGCYGASDAHTPHLDAVAASGVRFARAIAPAPLTLPSHTTLLTGLDPPWHGVRGNGRFRLPAGVPTLAERLSGAGFASAAFVAAFVLDGSFGLARGFEHYDDRTTRKGSGAALASPAERSADEVVDAALAWLETAPDRFFLWLHLYDPHAPYRPPPGFAAALPGRPYDGEIAFADAELGRLFGFLERRWQDGRTLLVITSDHGESLGEHGEPTHSFFVYDATQRVPLLLAGPGLPAGRVVEDVVALRDVAPTILDLVGTEPLPGRAGHSLLPFVRGDSSEPGADGAAYVEALDPQLEWGLSPLLGLRTEHDKYVRAPRPELYDLARDPDETQNRAAEEPDRVAELDRALSRRLADAPELAEVAPLSGEAHARLRALGYLLPETSDGPIDLLSLGVVGGTDPKDRIAAVRALLEANGLVAQGRPSAALERLAGIEADFFHLHEVRAGAALAAGEPERAEAAARAAIASHPEQPTGHRWLAAALERRGRLPEARAALEEASRLDPEAGEARTRLGELAEAAGDPAAAEAHYRAALSAPRPDPEAAWRLSALLLEGGREAERERLLADWAEAEASSNEAALRLARAELRSGLVEAAQVRLATAVARTPTDLGLQLAYAEALARAQAPEAAEVFREAIALAERSLPGADPAFRPLLLLGRARAQAGLSRADAARASLEEVLSQLDRLPAAEQRRVLRLAGELGVSTGGSTPTGVRKPPSPAGREGIRAAH